MRAVPISRAQILPLLIAVPLPVGDLAAQQVADTKFAPYRGFYPSSLSVTIRSETPGALVSYTTDGSPPAASGGQPSPVTVDLTRSTPLRAIAYVADGSLAPTNIDTQTYIILDAPMRWNGTSRATSSAYPAAVIDSLASLPALFVSLRPSDFATVRDSGTGNIGQSGGNEAYERPCSAELWYPDHPRYTGFEGFQIDAGLRPHSWVTTKRAFRLDFKTENAGAGFSSLDDTNGNDWIGWSTAAGASGAYRGIPNLAHDSEYFHPGDDGNPSTTTLERGGPVRATLRSISGDNLWELRWDIFPAYARLTVVRRNPAEAYWFLYEGTPGGSLSATTDFSVRPNGTRLPLGTAWTGDEWAYFEDSGLNRALYVIQHQPDAHTDSYWTLSNAMTVFGFGRLDLNSHLTAAPNVFTVGLADDASFANMQGVIDSAYRPLATTTGLPQAIPGRATYLAWAANRFDPATLGNAALEDSAWGPDADPEGDGITNLLELVTRGDPHVPDPVPLAIEAEIGDTFTVRFRAQRSLPGIVVTLNLSESLDGWQPTTADWQPAGFPDEWLVTLPAGLPARFARLGASLDE